MRSKSSEQQDRHQPQNQKPSQQKPTVQVVSSPVRNGSTSLIKRRSLNTQWQLQVQTAQREMAAVGQTRAQQLQAEERSDCE